MEEWNDFSMIWTKGLVETDAQIIHDSKHHVSANDSYHQKLPQNHHSKDGHEEVRAKTFLLWFQKIGWNYIVSSVIICVVIPILVYIELIYAIIHLNL